VNLETGELLKESTTTSKSVETEPDFVKLYLDDVLRLSNLPTVSNTILNQMLRYMNYENVITVTKFQKENIAQRLGVKVNTIEHAIGKFVKEGILTKVASGNYVANPYLFGKGKWANLRKLRLVVDYDAEGRSFHLLRNPEDVVEVDLEKFDADASKALSFSEYQTLED
jgi:hypothetical protein